MKSHEYAKQAASEFAQAAIKAGYRAFIAKPGNYGFYTDQNGKRVVSFQFNGYFENSVSGNYTTSEPRYTGTGWRISNNIDSTLIDHYWKASPRQSLFFNATWNYTTLKQHLKTYSKSSRYVEQHAE